MTRVTRAKDSWRRRAGDFRSGWTSEGSGPIIRGPMAKIRPIDLRGLRTYPIAKRRNLVHIKDFGRLARTSGGSGNHPHRHGAIYILMGGGESPSDERNGFTAVSVAMTNIFEEVPHTSSHLHSHTEAVLYVLEGVGFSEIDFEHWDWEAGDAVHVPPKMTRHEHFNPSEGRTRTLRIEFGIRYFYEPLWKGYWKVEHRETAIARP